MAKHYISLDSLIPWRQTERPVDWDAHFGRQAPIDLEIGFGNGERIVRRALANPEVNFVGLDISWPSARRAMRKIALSGLTNILLIQADAEVALTACFRNNSISNADALFPCPWPADKHHKRRLFSTGFLRLINSRLADGGVFRLVTDHREFYSWVQGQTPDTGFTVEYGVRGVGLETKYERKWHSQGQNEFFEVTLTKEQHMGLPEWKDVEVQAYNLDSFDADSFQCRDFVEADDERVSFKHLVFDPKARMGLLHTVVVEGAFHQAFFLEFTWQGDHWSLRPALGCGLAPTKGVKKALEFAYELAGGTNPPR